MSRSRLHISHHLIVVQLAAILLCAGCASPAPASAPPQPSAGATPAAASTNTAPPAATEPHPALQPSINAAVRATKVAQAVAATVSAPTPGPTLSPTPRVPDFDHHVPFLHKLSGIAGLMPAGWLLEGDAGGISIRSGPDTQGSLTATLTATAQLPAGGPAVATSDLFAQLKQPDLQVISEVRAPDGGGRLTLATDTTGLTTYVRATMTVRGLLVVQLTVPTQMLRLEDYKVNAVFDSVKPSGDYLTSTACLGGFKDPTPWESPFSPPDLGTLFGPALLYRSERSIGASGIGDFNGDGLDDVALVTDDSSDMENQLYVLLQRDDKTLAQPICFSTEGPEVTLAVGDLNGDHRDDVVVGGWGSQITLFLSAAEGVFGTRRTLPAGDSPDALAVGDLNGDGRDDVAVSHWRSDMVGIFLQQDDGECAPMLSLPAAKTGFDDIAIGDMNGDTLADVVRLRGLDSPAMEVFAQQPDHSFAPGVGYQNDLPMGGVAVGDVTGDGKSDLVAVGGTNRPASRIVVFAPGADNLLVAQANYPTYDAPRSLKIADLDGDGRSDVVILHWGFRRVSVSRQRPDGTLAEPEQYPIMDDSQSPQALDVGDLNGDGRLDVIIASPSGYSLLYGKASS